MQSKSFVLLLKLPINVGHVAATCNENAFSLIPLIRVDKMIAPSRNHVGH